MVLSHGTGVRIPVPLPISPSRLVFAIAAFALLLTASVSAQDAGGHLSGLVDTLARGERAYGVSTYDLSLENARSLARADIDYVYVDMEHGGRWTSPRSRGSCWG